MQSHISRRRVKASAAQLSCLAKHMQRHPEMATGNISLTLQGRANLEVLWHQLATKLNSLGGPIKTVFKWKQAWRDMRNNIRKKEFHKKQDIQEYELRTDDGQTLKEQSSDEKVITMLCPMTVYEMEEIVCSESTMETSQSPTLVQMTSRTDPETKVEVLDSTIHSSPAQRSLPETLSASTKRSRRLPPLGTFHNKLILIEREKLRARRKQNNILEEKNAILNRLVDVLQDISYKFDQ